MENLKVEPIINNVGAQAQDWKVEIIVKDEKSSGEERSLLQTLNTMIESSKISDDFKTAFKKKVKTSYYTTLIQNGHSEEEISTVLREKIDVYRSRPYLTNVIAEIYSELAILSLASKKLAMNEEQDLATIYPDIEFFCAKDTTTIKRTKKQ